jgi:hypothetical protein
MYQKPKLCPIHLPGLNQLVCIAFTKLCIAGDLLKFFIQKFIGSTPVDERSSIGEEKGDRLGKISP